MSDVSVTINPPNTTNVTIGNATRPHAATHAEGGSDSLEQYYYPRNNPSGYATSGDFATTGYVGEVSGYLYSQIAFPSNVVFTTGNQSIDGVKDFSSRPTINGTGVLLSGEASAVSTGALSGEFYPLHSNPSGYITGVDLSAYQTIAGSTGISGYLQGQVDSINSSSGAFLTTGAGDTRYANVTGDSFSGPVSVSSNISGQTFSGDYFDFPLQTNPSWKEGRVFYDQDAHTLAYYNDQSDVTLNIGQESVVRVSNGWTGTILNGYVVYISGAAGNRPVIYPASAINSERDNCVLGIATHDISTQGYVTTHGLVNGLNTAGFTEGDIIYLSETSGLFTATRPIAPNHTIRLGLITRSHVNQGQLYVNIDNGGHFSDLHDVRITGVADKDFVVYDSASGYWENRHLPASDITAELTGQWQTGYSDSITGVSVAGSNSKTITLYQRNGGTLTAAFTDLEGTGGSGSNYYLTGASFETGNLSLYVSNDSVVNVSLDGYYQQINDATGVSGYLQNQIDAIDLNALQTATGNLDTRVSSIEDVTGNFALSSDTGAFLTTGAGDSLYYPLGSNPNGYATTEYVTGISGYLQESLDNQQVGILNLNVRTTSLENGTGSFATTGYVTGASGYLQSQITAITNGTGDFITGVDLSAYQTIVGSTGISGYLQGQIDSIDLSALQTATGNLDTRLSAVEGVTGSFALAANTGAFLTTGAGDGLYYPLSSNPSNYLVAADIASLASTGYVTGVSGYLQSQITAIDLSALETATGNLDTRVSAVENATGGFALSSNTGSFLTTGAGDSLYYPLGSNPSGYATNQYVTGISGYLKDQIDATTAASYLDGITGIAVSGTTTKTVSIYNRAGTVYSAQFTDLQASGDENLKYEELYVDAGAMLTGISGATPTGIVIGGSNISFDSYSFGAGSNQYVQFKFSPPSNWYTGNLKAKFHWTANNGSTGHVLWGIQARSVGNDDAISGSWGVEQEILDQFITGYDKHLTEATSQIAPSNSPSQNDQLFFRVYRNADHATDTFGASAWLNGVSIQYSISGAISQW